MRVWAVGDRDRTDVTVQLHHVACDGMATVGFVAELLHGYAERIGVTGLPPLPPSRPEKLRGRGRFGLNAWRLLRILGRQAVGLIGVWKFAVAPPGAGGRPQFPRRRPVRCPRFTRRRSASELAAEETIGAAPLGQGVGGAVERPAGPRPVSGPRGLAPARSRPAKGRDWLRLTVPMSLRSPADFDMPAANVVSMVFLDRRSAEMADGRTAVAGHQCRDAADQASRPGADVRDVAVGRAAFARRAAAADRARRGARPPACCRTSGPCWPTPRCRGKADRIALGGAVLESIDAVGPLRPRHPHRFFRIHLCRPVLHHLALRPAGHQPRRRGRAAGCLRPARAAVGGPSFLYDMHLRLPSSGCWPLASGCRG